MLLGVGINSQPPFDLNSYRDSCEIAAISQLVCCMLAYMLYCAIDFSNLAAINFYDGGLWLQW